MIDLTNFPHIDQTEKIDEIRQSARDNDYIINLFYIPQEYDEIDHNAFYWIDRNILFIKESLTTEEHESEKGRWNRRRFGGIAEFIEYRKEN